MAKKRIAADVDLCGNSVENVKNVTASGTVKANTLEGKSNYVDCGFLSKDGWYRFASSPQLSGQTDAIFSVGHLYNNNIAENYLIAVSISYEGFATISQLSGSNAYGLYQIISKVRVVWSSSGYHIDFQVSKSVGAGNKFFVSQFGGIFDVFEATAAPELTSNDKVTELSLVNGMTCSEGFKGNVVGDVTGNVVGNVTGELTGTLGGRVAALPYYEYIDLGLTSSATDDEYIQALLKKIVSDHSDLLGKTLVGEYKANTRRTIVLYTYPTGTANGMPYNCSGMMYTGYTGSIYHFWINNGTFVSKNVTDSTGNLLGAKTDHVGNEIATTYATKSEVNNKVTKNNPDGVQAYEGNLKFGTGSVAGSVNPLDMALIPECGANRFAFIPPECITIEYSRDAGATWLDYGASDPIKRNIVTIFLGALVKVGGPDVSVSNPPDENCRLRITLKRKGSGLYANLHKFYAWVSTNGSSNCWWKIYGRNNASASNESGWISITNECKLTGWPGPNIINTGLATFGAGDSQFGELRFEFGSAGAVGSGYYGLHIYNIFAYGATAWAYPTEMAKTGHLYSYDYAQNATFPNGVTAKSFTGNLVGRANNALMDAENNNISATYLKKTDAESTYATKTTANGLQSQISSMVAKTQKLSSDGSTYSGKAVNDGEGNNISETYAKKTELPTASDGFYSAPKLIRASSDNATGDMILSIDHPCKGVSGVEFVLMTKTKRMRCGYKETTSDNKTKDTKRGWTIAQNFRRGKMSYGEDNPLPCVLNDVLDNYNTILQYVKKYYMYPFNTTATAVQTTGIPTTNLYFGGWNMTSNRKTAKVFGIAARRLKSDGKYEYSQPAAILITKTSSKGLRIGVL